MKKIYLLAAAAALFAACSSDKASLDTPQQPAQLEEGAVGFDVYTQRATTRGGWAGSLTTSTLQGFGSVTPKGGFGVFGYYTDNNEYDQRSTPNFFYNQLVYYNSGSWTYEPVKYWPNEYGTNAASEDQDKVTYFAYAPWIEVIPTSGKLADTTKEAEEWGITGMTRNSNQGDPILKYIASFNSTRSVDLCWGVADNNDGIWPITQGGKTLSYENGLPWIDVERPANTNQRVKFTFKHALAQMQVNIDAFVDGTDATNALSPKTRIWVREVTFKGFAMKGALNLHNEDKNEPKWLDYGGQNELVAEGVTIYDGRKDGKEGVNGAIATNEKVTGLNPILVQDGLYEGKSWKTGGDKDTPGNTVYNATDLHVYGVNASGAPQNGEDTYDRAGVTNKTVDLFAQNLTNANTISGKSLFHVIPTDEEVEVEIVYDVETVSENLAQNLSDGATKGSSIENRITKHITFGTTNGTSESKLEAGHSYTLNLHLGMNSVKFDAAVTDWIDVQEQDIDLPLNVPAFGVAAEATPGSGYTNHTVELPYAGDYTFALTGLNGGESVSYAEGSPAQSGWSGSTNNANTTGVAIQTMTIETNPTTVNRQHVATWVGQQSNLGAKFTFVQHAHPLNLKITKIEENEITLTRDAGFGEANGVTTGWLSNGTQLLGESSARPAVIRVWRNGTELKFKASGTLDPGEFTFSDTGSDKVTNKITVQDELQPYDVIKVELTTGDAPTETVTGEFVGTFGFYPNSQTITYSKTKTYKFTPYFAKGTVTYDKDDTESVLSLIETDGSFTTSKVGSAKITANDGTNDALLNITVNKQDCSIEFSNENSIDLDSYGANATAIDLAPYYNGVLDGKVTDTGFGNISWDITAGSDNFTKSGTVPYRIICKNALTAGQTYNITIHATHTGTSDKFNAPEAIDYNITITATP